MRRDVARHHGRAQTAGLELGFLDVQGSHLGALGVVQHGQVDGAGQVILGELGRAAHVDQGVEGGQGPGRDVAGQPRHQTTRTAGGPSITRPMRRASAKPSARIRSSTAARRVRGHGNQQAAAGLGIGQQVAGRGIEAVRQDRRRRHSCPSCGPRRRCGRPRAPDAAACGIRGDGLQLDAQLASGAARHLHARGPEGRSR